MAKRNDEALLGLPETTSAAKAARMKLDQLLREAHSLKGVAARLTEVKKEITELIQAQGLSDGDGRLGCRHGQFCAIVRFQNGRESFDRERAVEAGVTPEQIKASMKRGEGFWLVELPEIGAEG